VSIGIPVYNGERYLAQALNAIVEQTFGDFEVIISDNASTDGTREICERFASQDDRIRYFRQSQNRGGAWNFNEVVHRANGEYFKWAAHDDLIDPTFLQVCVENLDAAPPDVILCYPKTTMIDADGDVLSHYEDNLDIRQRTPAGRYRAYLKNYELSNAMFGLFRIDSLRKTRLHGTYDSADVVLFSEIAFVGQIWEVPDRLFKRRWHDGMSRRANPTNRDIALWFDPKNEDVRIMPRTRLFLENIRAVFVIRMSLPQQINCGWVLFAEWGPRYWRVVGGELKRELASVFRRRSHTVA